MVKVSPGILKLHPQGFYITSSNLNNHIMSNGYLITITVFYNIELPSKIQFSCPTRIILIIYVRGLTSQHNKYFWNYHNVHLSSPMYVLPSPNPTHEGTLVSHEPSPNYHPQQHTGPTNGNNYPPPQLRAFLVYPPPNNQPQLNHHGSSLD
jgi:hypothetical protein